MEVQMSSSYERRQDLMKTLEIPTISEVKEKLGLPLAEVVFDQCHEDLKKDLGLKPYLDGPGDELWVSPSDLLIRKVCLKAPLTQKHIQALTHKGILEIGAVIEQKYHNEMRLEKEKAMKEQEEFLNRMFQVEKSKLIAQTQEEERAKYLEQTQEMKTFFENKINELIWESYAQIQRLENEMQIEIDSLNILWQEKLQDEIKETIVKLTDEFLEKMRSQEETLTNIFGKQLQFVMLKSKCAIEFEATKSKQIILQMKHQLECRNIANLMYVLCKERRKCKKEKHEMERKYTKKIKQLRSQIAKQLKTIRRLTVLKIKQTKQIATRERILIEILRQFRKFIYFALKATPTQGEFLLNIDSWLKWELKDYCIQKSKKKIDPLTTKVSNQIKKISVQDVEQFLEIYSSKSSSEEENLEESEALPAFYFNSKLYVREDFRDMFEAGVEIDNTNPLWNRDVEELLKVFKQIVAEKRSINCQDNQTDAKLGPHLSSVHFFKPKLSEEKVLEKEITIEHEKPEKGESLIKVEVEEKIEKETKTIPLESTTVMQRRVSIPLNPTGSSLSPQKSNGHQSEKEIKSEISEGQRSKRGSIERNKEKKLLQTINNKSAISGFSESKSLFESLELPQTSRAPSRAQSRLTLARDSLILHISSIERKSLAQTEEKILTDDKLSTASRSNEEGDKTSITSETSDLKSTASLKQDTPRSPHTSKLLSATDSLEIIKSQLLLTNQKERKSAVEETIEKDIRKSLLTFNPQVVVKKVDKSESKVHSKKQSPKQKNKSSKRGAKQSPKQVAKVVGPTKTEEHTKTVEEFTEERIKSLVTIMKDNPSLIRLFTACSQ